MIERLSPFAARTRGSLSALGSGCETFSEPCPARPAPLRHARVLAWAARHWGVPRSLSGYRARGLESLGQYDGSGRIEVDARLFLEYLRARARG